MACYLQITTSADRCLLVSCLLNSIKMIWSFDISMPTPNCNYQQSLLSFWRSILLGPSMDPLKKFEVWKSSQMSKSMLFTCTYHGFFKNSNRKCQFDIWKFHSVLIFSKVLGLPTGVYLKFKFWPAQDFLITLWRCQKCNKTYLSATKSQNRITSESRFQDNITQ